MRTSMLEYADENRPRSRRMRPVDTCFSALRRLVGLVPTRLLAASTRSPRANDSVMRTNGGTVSPSTMMSDELARDRRTDVFLRTNVDVRHKNHEQWKLQTFRGIVGKMVKVLSAVREASPADLLSFLMNLTPTSVSLTVRYFARHEFPIVGNTISQRFQQYLLHQSSFSAIIPWTSAAINDCFNTYVDEHKSHMMIFFLADPRVQSPRLFFPFSRNRLANLVACIRRHWVKWQDH